MTETPTRAMTAHETNVLVDELGYYGKRIADTASYVHFHRVLEMVRAQALIAAAPEPMHTDPGHIWLDL